MSKVKTLSRGYKGNTSNIRSEKPKSPVSGGEKTKIDPQELINNIKNWHSEGRISSSDLQLIANQLQNINNGR